MNHNEQDFYSELEGLDARIERFATPDERRRSFLKEQVAGSSQGAANVEKLGGKALKEAAMTAGSAQTGRPMDLVRKGVRKRMKREG